MTQPTTTDTPLDVLIVGAGLSGIGAARHLQRRCPDQRYAIVEARDARWAAPGTCSATPASAPIRTCTRWATSSSPGRAAKAIADGPSILQLHPRDGRRGRHRRRRSASATRCSRADWHSADACWTVTLQHTTRPPARCHQHPARPLPVPVQRLLQLCRRPPAGVHGEADFRGRIVEPQFWPADLRLRRQAVVVVGSGATAVTLVPEMAKTAAHVTMLQRSPTYVVKRPSVDSIAQRLNRWLPAGLAYTLTRWKNVLVGRFFYGLARKQPAQVKQRLVGLAAAELGNGCRCGSALHAALQPVGSAGLRGARRRPVPADSRRPRLGRHRHDRPFHRHRRAAGQRAAPGSRHRGAGHRPAAERDRRHRHHRRRPRRGAGPGAVASAAASRWARASPPKRRASGMTLGTHGTTFGGNPLAMAVGNAVLDVILAPGFIDKVGADGAAAAPVAGPAQGPASRGHRRDPRRGPDARAEAAHAEHRFRRRGARPRACWSSAPATMSCACCRR